MSTKKEQKEKRQAEREHDKHNQSDSRNSKPRYSDPRCNREASQVRGRRGAIPPAPEEYHKTNSMSNVYDNGDLYSVRDKCDAVCYLYCYQH